MSPEWIVALVGLGSLLGLTIVILLVLAHHGFKTIISTLNEQGRDIKLIGERLGKCVTWSDLEKELGPLKADVKAQGQDLAELKAHCEERHK
jgi:hypothetical protein